MSDRMRFTPDRIVVREGETVRLVLHNEGRVAHEWILGTEPILRAHAEAMKQAPDMHHDAPWMAQLAPGRTTEIRWTFNRPGRFAFACLMPGHYEAGMTGTVLVSPAGRTPNDQR